MVTRTGFMLRMTALNDQFVGRLFVHSIRFTGTGLTVGELLRLTDINGNLTTEHFVTSTTEDIEILSSGADKMLMNGAKVAAMPTGSASLQIHLV